MVAKNKLLVGGSPNLCLEVITDRNTAHRKHIKQNHFEASWGMMCIEVSTKCAFSGNLDPCLSVVPHSPSSARLQHSLFWGADRASFFSLAADLMQTLPLI